MSEIVLINVSGQDKPGLTSSLTAILARYQINILDIGQAVIHDTLSLGMLIEIPTAAEPVVKKGAKQAISTLGLDGILYLMGIRDRETTN